MSNHVFKYTEDKLQSHFQYNKYFNKQFALMERFYLNKFGESIRDEDEKEFEDLLLTSIKSQFFNGYYMIREFLSHKESHIPDEFLSQPEGFLTEKVPEFINNMTQDNFREVITTNDMERTIKWVTSRSEDLRGALHQLAFEVVCLGARQALVDERGTRGLKAAESSAKGFMGGLHDVTFINPQLYLFPAIPNGQSEMWTLYWWVARSADHKKAGEVTIHTFTLREQTHYALHVYLSQQISKNERKDVIQTLLTKLMEAEDIPREKISVNVAVVEEFYSLVRE